MATPSAIINVVSVTNARQAPCQVFFWADGANHSSEGKGGSDSQTEATACGSGDFRDALVTWDFDDSASPVIIDDPRKADASTINLNTDQTGPFAAYTFRSAGTFTVSMTIRNRDGDEHTDTVPIVVSASTRTVKYVDHDLGSDTGGASGGSGPGASAWKTWEYALDNAADQTEIRFEDDTVWPFSAMGTATHSINEKQLWLRRRGNGTNPPQFEIDNTDKSILFKAASCEDLFFEELDFVAKHSGSVVQSFLFGFDYTQTGTAFFRCRFLEGPGSNDQFGAVCRADGSAASSWGDGMAFVDCTWEDIRGFGHAISDIRHYHIQGGTATRNRTDNGPDCPSGSGCQKGEMFVRVLEKVPEPNNEEAHGVVIMGLRKYGNVGPTYVSKEGFKTEGGTHVYYYYCDMEDQITLGQDTGRPRRIVIEQCRLRSRSDASQLVIKQGCSEFVYRNNVAEQAYASRFPIQVNWGGDTNTDDLDEVWIDHNTFIADVQDRDLVAFYSGLDTYTNLRWRGNLVLTPVGVNFTKAFLFSQSGQLVEANWNRYSDEGSNDNWVASGTKNFTEWTGLAEVTNEAQVSGLDASDVSGDSWRPDTTEFPSLEITGVVPGCDLDYHGVTRGVTRIVGAVDFAGGGDPPAPSSTKRIFFRR